MTCDPAVYRRMGERHRRRSAFEVAGALGADPGFHVGGAYELRKRVTLLMIYAQNIHETAGNFLTLFIDISYLFGNPT